MKMINYGKKQLVWQIKISIGSVLRQIGHRGGGLAFIMKENIKVNLIESRMMKTFEFTAWNLKVQNKELKGFLERGSRKVRKAPSPIFDHFNTTGNSITIDNFSIVGRKDQNLNRAIKEALFIRSTIHPSTET